MFCSELGYDGEVKMETIKGVYSQDAIQVGECSPSDASLLQCTGRASAPYDFGYNNGHCRKGQPVSFKLECSNIPDGERASCYPAVPCPAHSTGTNVPVGCSCDAGYTGTIAARTTYPYYSGTCDLTTAPTAFSVKAKGDPHLQNIYGQKFDLMMPGEHTLIRIPRGANRALLAVMAEAQRLGTECA